jgi:large subunit ribosomal protein L5
MKTINSKIKYKEKALVALKKKFHYENDMAVPRITKITVNSGVGKFSQEKGKMKDIKKSLETITGQKVMETKARKAISGFKTREGMTIGVKVTLRGQRMWDFIDRLVNVSLPRTRDFQGLEKSCIGKKGNLNIGIKEHIIFPEISAENTQNIYGLQVNISNTAKNQEEGYALFKELGFPLK